MTLFTLLFYGIFARFREQACAFICPYGRFQSVLLDENTIVVAYDHKCGEHRAPMRRDQSVQQRRALGHGDCIDCQHCLAVCPAAIDIRNGTQMECVHCTACIDACDSIMEKIGRPRGLIRYASFNGIEKGQKLKFTPRLAGYTALLAALGALLGFLIHSRADVQTTLLRAQGALFQKMPDGHFSNLYTVRVLNKSARQIPIELRLEKPQGTLKIMGGDLLAPPQQQLETSLLIELEPKSMKSGTTPLVVGVYANGRKIDTLNTAFIGPRDDSN
jgi:cytochrome c oxidase accessory protein FixG